MSYGYYNYTGPVLTKLSFSELPGLTKTYLSNLDYVRARSIDEAFLINLDRSTARLEQATYHLEKAEFPFTRFQAVDGYELNIKNIDTGEVVTGKQLYETTVKTKLGFYYEVSYNHKDAGEISYKFNGVLSVGELGVTASHIGIWKYSLEQGYNYIIIFEDDVVIRDHSQFNTQVQNFLDHLPSNFDAGFMDYYQVSGARYEIPGNDHVSGVSEDYMSWGTHAVIYSKKGMEKLVAQKFTEAVDINIWQEASYIDEDSLIVYNSEIKMADVGDQNTLSLSSTINMMGRYEPTNFDNNTQI